MLPKELKLSDGCKKKPFLVCYLLLVLYNLLNPKVKIELGTLNSVDLN